MKHFIYLVLVLIVLSNCREKKTKVVPEIETLVGKWQLFAREENVGGKMEWVQVQAGQDMPLHFRYDGVILGANELPLCCGPASYLLNGVEFKIEPKSSLPNNPECLLVDCVGCAQWKIEQSGDELIISPCLTSLPALKYRRK